MKSLICSVAFCVSLLFGTAAAWLLFVQSSSKVQVNAEPPRPALIAANQATPRVKNIRAFKPEFTDLPNLDDGYITPTGKLIDLWVEDGLYRQSDVVAKNGESWLVLAKNGETFNLERATASVKKLKTGSWPGDENDAKLSFKASGKLIFAVRNIPSLSAGPIPTMYQQGIYEEDLNGEPKPSDEISDGYRREFVLESRNYVLRTSQGVTKDGTKAAVLVLEHGDTKQVIRSTYYFGEEDRDIIGTLLWVGDMDRDGKLDLYIDEFNEKGFTRTELYLSSRAGTNELVSMAATFGAAGC